MSEKKTIQQLSVDVQIVVKLLAACEVGKSVSYAEISKLIGRPIQSKRDILQSARRIAQRDHKAVFSVTINEGLTRMSDAEIAESWVPAVGSIRRKCSKSAKTVAVADYTKLSPEQQRKSNTGLAIVGAIAHFTKPKSADRISEAVNKDPKRLDFSETIALFNK